MNQALISYCIPSGNRVEDLKQVMPTIIASANLSPPVEILVLSYNSSDGIDDYAAELQKTNLAEGNSIRYLKYAKGAHFHMAHSRNLAIKSSHGDYIVTTGTDMYVDERFFAEVRKAIAAGSKWIRLDTKEMPGFTVIARDEFMAAGGYDERFELYGPEDKELNERLERRGLKHSLIDHRMVNTLRTPNQTKAKNYRFDLSKRQMVERMIPFYEENTINEILIANEGIEWGQA